MPNQGVPLVTCLDHVVVSGLDGPLSLRLPSPVLIDRRLCKTGVVVAEIYYVVFSISPCYCIPHYRFVPRVLSSVAGQANTFIKNSLSSPLNILEVADVDCGMSILVLLIAQAIMRRCLGKLCVIMPLGKSLHNPHMHSEIVKLSHARATGVPYRAENRAASKVCCAKVTAKSLVVEPAENRFVKEPAGETTLVSLRARS